MEWSDRSYLACTCSFFKNCPCPCLDKLFIQLLATEDPIDSDYQFEGLLAEDTSEIVFDHLKVIKMNGFTGLKDEMQLVKFFLKKAIVLESLVLVAPQKGVCDVKEESALECKSDHASLSKSVDMPLDLLCEQPLILTKASSSDVRILICEYSDDNGALLPTHTGDYCFLSIPLKKTTYA